MSEKSHYQITVTVLSPLHVGSGGRLREGLDFIEHRGSLWIANQGALMAALLDEIAAGRDLARAADALTGKTLYDLQRQGWLRDEHFDPDKGLFHYRLPGRASSATRQGELHEQIKDVYRRPYLPGSSLKGALRTAIAWNAVRERKMQITADRLGRSPRFAGQPVERDLFGGNPNFDLLRALQVADSAPIAISALGLAAVRMTPPEADRDKLAIDVEAIAPETVFQMQASVDGYLLDDPRAGRLRFRERAGWLQGLAQIGQRHARQRLINEVKFHQAHGQPRGVMIFYDRLATLLTEQLAADEFLLQLSWGAGWDSKTLNGELRKNPVEFARIVNAFSLDKGPQRGQRGPGKPFAQGDEFPITRKLATMAQQRITSQPMGWVKIKLEQA